MNYRLLFLLVWSKNNNNSSSQGWSNISTDALYWLANTGLLFHLSNTDPRSGLLRFSVMVHVFTQEERGPRESKWEEERGDKLNEGLWPDGLEACWSEPTLANTCKRQACFNYSSLQQIDYCHTRMRYFSTLISDQSTLTNKDQINICT